MWIRSLGVFLFLANSVLGAELPAGTEIQIRLKQKVASNAAKSQDPIEAVVIAPVKFEDYFAIPAGAVLRGRVVTAQASAAADQRAILDLHFDELLGANGKSFKLATKISDVDNARESVDENGKILGILASESLSARMDQGLGKLGQRASGLADFLQLAKNVLLKTAESEVIYEPGVEMTLQLTAPWRIDAGVPGVSNELTAIDSADRLQEVVIAQPFQTWAEKPHKPSDMTNLMFVGSQQKIEAAFAAAGWASAASLTKASGWETFRAIAEQRGYKEAPMSVLLLDDRGADLNFQKQNNTFAQRHHLRIWRRPVQWEGKDVWISSSTHDTGIDFSQENRTFIHKIDPRIDRERAKVVSDLVFTGLVKSLALVDRPAVPKESQNATGDKLETDGRMAVLILR